MKTGLLSLSARDFLKGFVLAILTAVVSAVYSAIQEGGFPSGAQWKNIALIAAGAGLSYLLKNLFTPTNTEAAEIVKEAAKEEATTVSNVVHGLTEKKIT